MVRPKKHLGQHFLKDQSIALRIARSLTGFSDYSRVLEIGPGTGVLTRHLLESTNWDLWMIDVDRESIDFLRRKLSSVSDQIILGDFLKWDGSKIKPPYAVIGNFPYNISSQILFKILDYRHTIPEVVCMLQKEVAKRLVSSPGNKAYGILSVFLQAYYKLEYLFDVPPSNFHPPPKVDSAVIRLQTLGKYTLECDENLFRSLVKQGFQNRRKTLRNALKGFNLPQEIQGLEVMSLRAEQLSVDEYITLTKTITPFWNH
ncbi:MAG: ribosomal RNA small subunit methyltransferase A [Cyclobacteriaceae bacterium]|nr:MAG: ribosomal RNA small subunit methyltransferase A [Cyclobacteriaceae bacterium]